MPLISEASLPIKMQTSTGCKKLGYLTPLQFLGLPSSFAWSSERWPMGILIFHQDGLMFE